MSIQQGDQYIIPFKVKNDKSVVTPEKVDDVRIKVGGITKSLVDETLVYDPETECWEFPLTQEQTRAIKSGMVSYQVGVKVGGEIVYSRVGNLQVNDSIIQEDW
jgi:hypothetical protein